MSFQEAYKSCTLCPRACRANRTDGAFGACHAGASPRVAHTMLHMWEEPCISGERGSGTVFFSGCPLGCVYCQNRDISGKYIGAEHDERSLADLFASLEKAGAHNVNLVTGTHHIPHIATAISLAREAGLGIPVVYNTSGYERPSSLAVLDGLVDIYLTDLRYKSAEPAARYTHAPDYPRVAFDALSEMVRQTGAPRFDAAGMMQKGVIVRILLLPGHLIEAKQILRTVFSTFGESIYISLMSQYTPVGDIGAAFPNLSRRVTPYEYASFVDYARTLGVTQAFTQEGESASESFIPPFCAEK